MKNKLDLYNLCIGINQEPLCDPISGSFEIGTPHLVLGPSGSGKTTLLRTIAGLTPPISGYIKLNQENHSENPSNVLIAPQNPESIFFCSSVQEEIIFPLQQLEVGHHQALAQGEKWARCWGISPEIIFPRNPWSLSGGEQRKTGLAACTILQSMVILLDEPLASLDWENKIKIREHIFSISQSHIVILATHEPELFISKAGKCLLLSNNKHKWFDSGIEFLKSIEKNPSIFPLSPWFLLKEQP